MDSEGVRHRAAEVAVEGLHYIAGLEPMTLTLLKICIKGILSTDMKNSSFKLLSGLLSGV